MTKQLSFLLVDDDHDIRGALRRTLKDPEIILHEASDGVEALAMINELTVDGVISDYDMPRMNGLELLTQVRIVKPAVLRVLLTGRVDMPLAVRALNEGSVHRFLLKPWDHIDLKGILRIALHTMKSQNTGAVDNQ